MLRCEDCEFFSRYSVSASANEDASNTSLPDCLDFTSVSRPMERARTGKILGPQAPRRNLFLVDSG